MFVLGCAWVCLGVCVFVLVSQWIICVCVCGCYTSKLVNLVSVDGKKHILLSF